MENNNNRRFYNNQNKIDFDKLDFNKIVRILRALCNFLEEVKPAEVVENGDN